MRVRGASAFQCPVEAVDVWRTAMRSRLVVPWCAVRVAHTVLCECECPRFAWLAIDITLTLMASLSVSTWATAYLSWGYCGGRVRAANRRLVASRRQSTCVSTVGDLAYGAVQVTGSPQKWLACSWLCSGRCLVCWQGHPQGAAPCAAPLRLAQYAGPFAYLFAEFEPGGEELSALCTPASG